MSTQRSRSWMEAAFRAYLPLADQMVRRVARRLPASVPREDLLAAAHMALWEALNKHRRDDAQYEWYLRVRLRGAVLDELRRQDWLPRRARRRAPEGEHAPRFVDVDRLTERDLALVSSREPATSAEASMQAALATLTERDQRILSAHYLEGLRLKDLSRELGVSEPRVSQLHGRAVRRLREALSAAA